VATVASTGEGVPDLVRRLSDHHGYLEQSGQLEDSRRRRVRAEVLAVLGAALRGAWESRQERAIDDILAGTSTPSEEARRLWRVGG